MRLIVTLILVAMGLVETLAATQNSYLIESRQVSDPAEAITILRRFMSIKLQPDERCEKYAVMLNSIAKSNLDQFQLAEIGLERMELTRQKFRSIDIETLRQLYSDGISTFTHGSMVHIDAGMLDLVNCLSKKFRTLDAKARKFLNNQDLQETLQQYNSIMSQPLDFLVNPSAKHPDLTIGQLKPAVKNTLLDIFNHDVNKVNSRFQGPIGAINGVDPVEAAAKEASFEGQEAAGGPLVGGAPGQSHSPVGVDEVFTGDDLELLQRVIGSLHDVYNNLPVESKLGDRCEAYGKTLQAENDQLNHQLVDRIVHETANKIATSGPTDEIYKPDANARENFLFILSSFPKEDVGHETWIDLVDCISQWSDEDPKVREFMSSPEQVQIFEELMKATEGHVEQFAAAPPTSQVAMAQAGTINRA